MKKVIILDTNVPLTDPECIFKFEENLVVIPLTLLEEIDNFKRDKTELGANCRAFARHMDTLRTLGDLRKGVKVNDLDGRLFVIPFDQTVANCLPYQDMSVMDNRILATAVYAKTFMWSNNGGTQISDYILVTKDINLRVRADIFGIVAEDYKNTKIQTDELYTGHEILVVSNDIIERVY